MQLKADPEREWWASAPPEAKWHTWDKYGKAWWAKRPTYNGAHWSCWPIEDAVPFYASYDMTPCPVEIDPSKTLRKRPKEEPQHATD